MAMAMAMDVVGSGEKMFYDCSRFSLRTQTYFRRSVSGERNDRRKYVCVRRLFRDVRKCASFSKNGATQTPLSPQANIVPKKSIEIPPYNNHRTKKPTEFHSPSPTIHKTLQSKTSKFPAMIPKLNTSFLYHHLFHSNATKT